MSECECKVKTTRPWTKNKCRVCKSKICDTCYADIQIRTIGLCKTCQLVVKTDFEYHQLLLLSERQLMEIASFFNITITTGNIDKTDIVILILSEYHKNRKKLRNLMRIKFTFQDIASETSNMETDTCEGPSKKEVEFQMSKEIVNCQHNTSFDLMTFPEDLTAEQIPTLTTSELKHHLQRLQIDHKFCIEKDDYRKLLYLYLKEGEEKQTDCKGGASTDQLRLKPPTPTVRNIRVSSRPTEAVSETFDNVTHKKHVSMQDIGSLEMIPSLTIPQLKHILETRSVDCRYFCEKSELAYRVSLLYHQLHRTSYVETRTKTRKTSKREAFYLPDSEAKNSEATVGDSGRRAQQNLKRSSSAESGSLKLYHIKSANAIENLSGEQLKSILDEHSISCPESANQKWEMAFKVLQLWCNNQARREEDLKRCVICMENDIDCTILECGHTVLCRKCVGQLNKCPICCDRITRIVKIFKP